MNRIYSEKRNHAIDNQKVIFPSVVSSNIRAGLNERSPSSGHLDHFLTLFQGIIQIGLVKLKISGLK